MRIVASPRSSIQLLEDAHDLGLDRDVERGGRLVRDQKLGLDREAHRDHRALAHPAGELVWVGIDPLGGAGDPDRLQQLDRARARVVVGDVAVGLDLLDDLRSDAVARG